MDDHLKKKLGAFYSSNEIVDFIIKKTLLLKPNNILEPSFGDGIFIKNLKKFNYNNTITCIEIEKNTFTKFKNDYLKKNIELINQNFLTYNKNYFDAIIGNPPFVRTRFLHNNQKLISVNYYKKKLKLKSLSDPSTWLLFVYHSISLLKKNGSISFILPYDFTFVTYAKPLWEKLFSSFGKIEIHHTKKRYFPNILQDTIVLFAQKFGRNTNKLNFFIYLDGINKKYDIKKIIYKDDIIKKGRPFKYALISPKFKIIEKKISKKLSYLSELIDFHIGYVSGNKKFFHPSIDVIKKYMLNNSHLIKTIADTKILKDSGIYTSNILTSKLNDLFYPTNIDKHASNYISLGKKESVNKQHKTSKRDDWYMVPLIKKPDYLVTVFNEFPLMILNDKKYLATNTFLCGYLKNNIENESLLNNWYSSLTQLYIELEVHSLGGGMLVMVPQEISQIKVPFLKKNNKNFLKKVNLLAKNKKINEILDLGDQVILKDYLKLTSNDLKVIKDSIKILKFWRIPN